MKGESAGLMSTACSLLSCWENFQLARSAQTVLRHGFQNPTQSL